MPFTDRRLPLAAALGSALILAAGVQDAAASAISPAALAHALHAVRGAIGANALAGTVTSCADDGAAGTLRSVISVAGAGETIDMTGLPAANANCAGGTIALTSAILMTKDLVLAGPPNATLAVAAPPGGGRVFKSTGSSLQINDLTVSGGAEQYKGGCIYSTGSVALQHSVVTDCKIYGTASPFFAVGAGIYANNVTLTQGSVVKNGHAFAFHNGKYGGAGGGVSAKTLFVCSDSTISDNYANGVGGGVLLQGTASISRCTISGNSSPKGGGIDSVSVSAPMSTIAQSTISGNLAVNGGGLATAAAFTVLNSTIAFNSATTAHAAGIYAQGALELQSSIVARNISPGSAHADLQVAGALTGADNLVESTDAGAAYGVITKNADPQLLTLADNGGPTLTHALAAASPAIDVGNNAALYTNDQRGAGFAREVPAGQPDIGAFEFRGDGVFYDGFE